MVRKLWFLLFLTGACWAQGPTVYTVTGTACTAVFDTSKYGTVGISVVNSGTAWSGTIQPKVVIGTDSAQNVNVTPYNSSTAQSTITANGMYRATVAGSTGFQVCGNTVTNTAQVTVTGIPLSANVNAGTGSGTVTSVTFTGDGTVESSTPSSAVTTSGTVTATLANAGAGTVLGNATASSAAPTYTSQPVLGVGGGTGGQYTLNGATSGSAVVSVTATGGTMVFPAGTTTNPAFQFSGNASNSGFAVNGAGGAEFVSGGVATSLFGANGVAVPNAQTIAFNRTGTREAGIGDGGAATGSAVLTLDSTSIGNEGALMRSANTCRITADVALTVNTPNSFCSYSLPGAAKAWAFSCDVLWNLTAGTGTNTFALGVNASQTPTAATNANGTVYTTATGTETDTTTAISASGATSIATSATYTPGATVLKARITGTVLASATAGTFAITASANGTTATANVKAGSMCYLF